MHWKPCAYNELYVIAPRSAKPRCDTGVSDRRGRSPREFCCALSPGGTEPWLPDPAAGPEHRWGCSFGLVLESSRTWWCSWPNICYFSKSEIFKIWKYKHYTGPGEESHPNLLWIEAAPGFTGLWPSKIAICSSQHILDKNEMWPCSGEGTGHFVQNRDKMPNSSVPISTRVCVVSSVLPCSHLHVQAASCAALCPSPQPGQHEQE